EAEQTMAERELVLSSSGELRETIVVPEVPGVFRAVVMDSASGEALASTPFLVDGEGEELARVRPDSAFLAQISEESGGKSFDGPSSVPSLEALREVEERVVGEDRRSPFREPWFAWLVLAVVTVELLVRRRLGRT